ncbi:MAG: hypothetical protein GY853_11100 [PVC group bacterium]|nr:hypothetical protein [PVC group bacterium]
MIDNYRNSEQEIYDLKKEIEQFKEDRDRVRAIVGQLGGIPTFNTKMFNVVFAIFVLACLLISLRSGGVLQLAMIELAVAAISVKLMYLMHCQSRVDHFQLWILTSMEWRLNETIKLLKEKEGK